MTTNISLEMNGNIEPLSYPCLVIYKTAHSSYIPNPTAAVFPVLKRWFKCNRKVPRSCLCALKTVLSRCYFNLFLQHVKMNVKTELELQEDIWGFLRKKATRPRQPNFGCVNWLKMRNMRQLPTLYFLHQFQWQGKIFWINRQYGLDFAEPFSHCCIKELV